MTEPADKFLERMAAIMAQATSKHVADEGNTLVMRKAGSITVSDIKRLMTYATGAHKFIEHNGERPTL